MVITQEIYKDIRRMRLDGMSQRQIAGVLHVSRNTVKKYWDGNSVPWERMVHFFIDIYNIYNDLTKNT